MLSIFRSNRAFVLILLPFFTGVFFFLNNYFGYHHRSLDLSLGLFGVYRIDNTIYSSILSLVLIVFGAILLNNIFNKNRFVEKNNYLPSILYVIYSSFFHSFYFIDGFGIAQFLIIVTLSQLLLLDQKVDGRKTVFNVSIYYGLACTFFPLLTIGIPFLFFMIWVNRPFVFRESILTLTGLLVPFLYASAYIYFFNTKISLTELNSSSGEIYSIDMWVVIFSCILFIITGLKQVIQKVFISSIRLKKVFRVLFLLTILLLSLFFLDVLTYRKVQTLNLIIIPIVFVLPYSFGEKKAPIVSSLLFYFVFLFSVCKFFVPFNDLAF